MKISLISMISMNYTVHIVAEIKMTLPRLKPIFKKVGTRDSGFFDVHMIRKQIYGQDDCLG
jgi:hypothetical protein